MSVLSEASGLDAPDVARNRWLKAARASPPPDKTDFTDKTAFAGSEVRPEAPERDLIGAEQQSETVAGFPKAASPQRGLPRHANPVRDIMGRLEGDMEAYAEALRVYGPMSYGQAMNVLGWGATRAGHAETDLRSAGRIRFNALGRAALVKEIEPNDQ